VIRRARRSIELALAIGLAFAWALTLRPTSLGGPATYVVIRGDSMLPGYHSGDLVVLEAGTTVGPGDVIGYRVPEGEVGAGHIVVHRIVAGDGAHGFILEGDNNPAPDPWQPRLTDVAGKVWIWVPRLGWVITLAHQPVVAGALAASLMVMLLLSRRPAAPAVPAAPAAPRARRRRSWGLSRP